MKDLQKADEDEKILAKVMAKTNIIGQNHKGTDHFKPVEIVKPWKQFLEDCV